ncbi:MAG: TonB-dependent receptor [Pseudomonadota bacterium]
MVRIFRSFAWSVLLVSVCSVVTSEASEGESTDNKFPVVLTPTRLKQSLADVPASITVITTEMLRRFNVRSIPDALRLVPGMAVVQVSGNDYRISYHGTDILTPRRMNILIDGVSSYRPRIARFDWKNMPIDIEDIERIEVTRGPDSASYGANSMLAIINVISKHPRDVTGSMLKARGGSLNAFDGTARHGGEIGSATSYRLTASHQEDSGYDFATTSKVGKNHDASRVNRLNFRSVTEIASDQTLDVDATILDGMNQNDYIDPYQTRFPDIALREYELSARWRNSFSSTHDLQIQTYLTKRIDKQPWTTCLPPITLLPQMFDLWRANPAYVQAIFSGRTPSGGTAQDDALAAAAISAYLALGPSRRVPICVDANQNYAERRYDLEVQDTSVLTDTIRLVSGFGLRQDTVISQTYTGGQVSNNSWSVFANAEYKPSHLLTVNAGGFFQKDQITGAAFSPRIAFNTHLDENHTLRFVISKANRMPDLTDQRANWTYETSNYSRPLNGATSGLFYASALSPGNLNSERILSREIGYLGNFPQYGLLVDVKLFDDKLDDLVSEKLQLYDFKPTNNNSVRLRGSELQITYKPTDQWQIYLACSNIHNNASTLLEQTLYSKNSGSLAIAHELSENWQWSFAYYGFGSNAASASFYGREDVSLSNKHRIGQHSQLTTTLTAQHLDNRTTTYFVNFNTLGDSRYNSAVQYYLTMKLTF